MLKIVSQNSKMLSNLVFQAQPEVYLIACSDSLPSIRWRLCSRICGVGPPIPFKRAEKLGQSAFCLDSCCSYRHLHRVLHVMDVLSPLKRMRMALPTLSETSDFYMRRICLCGF